MNSVYHAYMFTDGSCATGSDQCGAWGAVVVNRESSQLLSGALRPTTISRCELYPVVEGLRYVRSTLLPSRGSPSGMRIMLVSDSEYVVKTIGGLYEASRNDDLWSAYRQLVDGLEVVALHRSRNSHPLMLLADSLAHSAYGLFSGHMSLVDATVPPPPFSLIETHPLTVNEEIEPE